MADNAVQFTFFANAAAAEKAIVQLERKYGDLENRVKNMSKESRKGSQDSVISLEKMGGALASIAARYVAIPALIGQVLTAQRELTREADETATRYDELFKKFRVQSGLSGIQGTEAKGKILDLAQKNAVPEQFAAAAATQLVSSGFSPSDATGGALDILLQTLQATNNTKGDPTEIAKAASQFLAAQGMDKNAANLRNVLIGGQRLFKDTDFQLVDLGQVAGKSAGMAGKLSPQEIMGAFDVVRNVKNADTASTGLKIFVERLAGASGDKAREKELSALGLKPKDVDFIGERFGDVLEQLGRSFDKVSPDRRAGIMQRLVGTEGSEAAEVLIRERDKIRKAIEIQNDRGGFMADVREATSGRAAAVQRIDIAKNRVSDARADGGDLFGEQLAILSREQGISETQTRYRKGLFDLLRGFGVNPETAAKLGMGAESSDITEARNRVDQVTGGSDAQSKLLESQTRVLERIEANTRRQTPNRNANGEK